MRLLTYIVCVIFTFVSTGGTIYVHHCKENTVLSLYEKVSIQSCPFCENHHKSPKEKNNPCEGDCKDSIVKIDQFSDKNFNTSPSFFAQLSPAIIPILWIVNFTSADEDFSQNKSTAFLYSYADSSPPIYIQHCTFRI